VQDAVTGEISDALERAKSWPEPDVETRFDNVLI